MIEQPVDTADSPDTASAVTSAASVPATGAPARSNLDRFMRRLLRLPVDGPKATAAEAQKAFQTSILVASARCLLMYIFFPFVLPAIGVARGVGPWIGLPISIAAIVAITMSVRRFWRADHSKRWHYTAIGTAVMLFMMYEIVRDVVELAS